MLRTLVILIVVAAWVAAGLWVLGINVFSGFTEPETRQVLFPTCEDCQVVRVDRIIDGDTLDSSVGRIRLYGVDTPERGDRCFSEATERLRELAGDNICVETSPREPFRGALGYLQVSL